MKTFGTLILRGDAWVIDDMPPHVLIKLKALFPKIPKAKAPPYKFAATLDNAADLVWFESRYPLEMDAVDRFTLEGMQRRHTQISDEMDLILTGDFKPRDHIGLTEGSVLRPYQGQAVEISARSNGLLLADDLGLGKTIVGAGVLLLPGALPGIVVCPGHLQKQWARVLSGDKDHRAFTNLTTYQVNTTRPHMLPPADVLIFRYSQMIGWADAWKAIKPKTVIYDEVHELRSGEAAGKGTSAKRLSALVNRRLGLSATPIFNYGVEIWNIMQFLSPNALGAKDDFVREWAPSGKVEHPDALGTHLRDQHVFLRRSKKDVGQDMPPVNRIIETIDYDHKTVAAAEDLARQLAIKATSGIPTNRGAALMEMDMKLRQATGIAKARGIANFIRILVEAGQPVVVALWHREVYAIIMQSLEDLHPVMYTGSESPAQKQAAIDSFIGGKTDVFLLSLRSGAGIDGLQHRASTIVVGELDWSPATHEQCLSDDTEILTPAGWRGVDQVEPGDRMYGFNVADSSIHPVEVLTKVDRAIGDGEAIYEVETHRVSLRVTGGHRMVVRAKRRTKAGVSRGSWAFSEAATVAGIPRRYVPTFGLEEGKGVPLRDCDLRLIGWFMSDGNMGHARKAIHFYQAAHQPWNKDLIETLDACGLRWTVMTRDTSGHNPINIYSVAKSTDYHWREDEIEELMAGAADGVSATELAGRFGTSVMAVQKKIKKMTARPNDFAGKIKDGIGWGYIEDYLDKDLSPLLAEMTAHQLRQLIHGLNMGDGRKGRIGGFQITSVNKLMLDRLQSLCVRRGLQAKIMTRKTPTSAGNAAYDIAITEDADAILPSRTRPNGFREVAPKPGERVWCVSNELSTIIIRRRGKVSIVGNCIGRLHRDGQVDPVTAFFLVSEGGSDPPIMDVLGLKASEANGIVNPGAGPQIVHTDTSRLQALLERYLEKKAAA